MTTIINGIVSRSVSLIIFLCIVATLASFLLFGFENSRAPVNTERTDSRVVDYASFLGEGWTVNTPRIIHRREDPIGRTRNVVSSSSYVIRNKNEYYSFIDYHVTEYENAKTAEGHYPEIVQYLFRSSLYDEDAQTLYLDISKTNPNAQEREIYCHASYSLHLLEEMQCEGVFLYSEFIVYINIFPTRNYNTFLNLKEIESIFRLADQQMVQSQGSGDMLAD